MNLRLIFAYALGAIEALLLARLVLRLMAARPDNSVVAALYAATAPRGPLAALDAGQPRFGATLEYSTLALFLLILIAALLVAWLWGRAKPAGDEQSRGTR